MQQLFSDRKEQVAPRRGKSSGHGEHFIFHDAKRTSLVVKRTSLDVKYTSHDVKHKIPRAMETFSPSVCRFSLGGLWHFFGVSASFLWRSCNISFEFLQLFWGGLLQHFFGVSGAFLWGSCIIFSDLPQFFFRVKFSKKFS